MKKDSENNGIITAFLLVPRDWLEQLEENQLRILRLLKAEEAVIEKSPRGEYLTEAEAAAMIGKRTTWFWTMRTTGRLPFSKVGKRVFYKRADVIALMDQGYQK